MIIACILTHLLFIFHFICFIILSLHAYVHVCIFEVFESVFLSPEYLRTRSFFFRAFVRVIKFRNIDYNTIVYQFSSVTQLCPILCTPMNRSMPGLPVHHQLLESTQTHVHWVNDAIQPSHPLSSPSPPALNLSEHQGLFYMSQLFASGGQSIWASASTSVLPINTQDWSPLGWTGWISLQVLGTLKSLLQHHSSKAPILQHSAFFIVQLSHPYMTTGKTIALTRRTFVGKVMSLLFNMLPRLVITFLPRSKRLLISWLQSPSAVILEP